MATCGSVCSCSACFAAAFFGAAFFTVLRRVRFGRSEFSLVAAASSPALPAALSAGFSSGVSCETSDGAVFANGAGVSALSSAGASTCAPADSTADSSAVFGAVLPLTAVFLAVVNFLAAVFFAAGDLAVDFLAVDFFALGEVFFGALSASLPSSFGATVNESNNISTCWRVTVEAGRLSETPWLERICSTSPLEAPSILARACTRVFSPNSALLIFAA